MKSTNIRDQDDFTLKAYAVTGLSRSVPHEHLP